MVKRFLLLIGSPRKKGTSYSFARTFSNLAAGAGCSTEMEFVYDYYDGKRSLDQLKERIADSDIVGLIAPLYYDTIPGAAAWLFEELYRDARAELAGKGFFVIGQSAYPFTTLMDPMIGQCGCFARATAMNWLGGMGYGGGVMIDGKALEAYGKLGRMITDALRLALDDMLGGRMISEKPRELLVVKVPRFVFRLLAIVMNFRIRSTARKLGVKDLEQKVYLME